MKRIFTLALGLITSLTVFSQSKIDAKSSGFTDQNKKSFTTTYQNLELKGQPSFNREVFLGFDLPQKSKPYSKVILRIRIANASQAGVSVPLSVDGLPMKFDKSMTWESRPAEDKYSKAAEDVVLNIEDKDEEQNVDFDVTDYVNSLLVNKTKNVVLRISGKNDKTRTMLKIRSAVYFDKDRDRTEVLGYRPKLIVEP